MQVVVFGKAIDLEMKDGKFVKPPELKALEGNGSALKPAWEPVLLCRKPLSERNVAANVLRWGTGAINVDACRVEGQPPKVTGKGIRSKSWRDKEGRTDIETETISWEQPSGRWPANLIHDGSDEVVGLFPQTTSHGGGKATYGGSFGNGKEVSDKTAMQRFAGDSGSAARFFYCAKASRRERNAGCEELGDGEPDAHNLSSNACARCGKRVKANGSGDKCECGELRETIKLPRAANHHPTVKPLALMEYLIRLVSREGAIVLDPFLGSGTTALAAKRLGRHFVGIELSEEYCEIARKRIEAVLL